LADIDELYNKLAAFKADGRAEVEFGPIEKFMIEELGVNKIETGKAPGKKRGQGSKLFYYHPALKEWGQPGQFTVHRVHKKRLMIYKRNFDNHLYLVLKKIIIALAKETNGEN